MPRRLHRLACSLALAAVIAALPAQAADRSSPRPVCPGSTWSSLTPAEAGLDASRLDAAVAKSGTSAGCIVRYGHVVKTWGDQRRTSGGGSVIKPVFAHLLFEAVKAGKLSGIDDLVATCEPRLNELNAALGYKDRRIRFRHMANQTSCYSAGEDSGTAFDYNDYQMALFGDTLFFQVWGASSFDDFNARVAQPYFIAPLQMEDGCRWDANGRFPMSIRDHCRFVLLYLRRGQWHGRSVLSANDVLTAVCSAQPGTFPDNTELDAEMIDDQRSMGNFNGLKNPGDRHGGSYSFAWWTNGLDRHGQRRLPDCPPDLFGCAGGGGAAGVHALPGLDLIVAFRTSTKNRLSDSMINAFHRDVLAAVVDPGPANRPPVVDAGPDQRVVLPARASLTGTATDDGKPGQLTTLWHLINGPGVVSFANANAVRTTASFSDAGRYVLRLTADDGSRLASDDVVLEVDSPGKPVVTIEATDPAAAEAEDDGGTFRVHRFGATDAPLTVRFASVGTATAGEDCNDFGSSVTIPAGSRSATIAVKPVDDRIAEGWEVVFLKLAPDAAYAIGTPSGAGIRIDDNDTTDPIVTVSAHDPNAAEPRNRGRFVLTGSRSLYGKTVRFTLTGTATNGKDYGPVAESVSFADSLNPVIEIAVTPIDDAVREGTETVTLTLSPGSGYAVGTPRRATISIRDND